MRNGVKSSRESLLKTFFSTLCLLDGAERRFEESSEKDLGSFVILVYDRLPVRGTLFGLELSLIALQAWRWHILWLEGRCLRFDLLPIFEGTFTGAGGLLI